MIPRNWQNWPPWNDQSYERKWIYTNVEYDLKMRSLFTVQCIHRTGYTVYTVHCVQGTLCILYLLYSVQCIMHDVHRTSFIVFCILYNIQLRTVYGLQTTYDVQCTTYIHCTLFKKHSIVYIVQCKLYSVYCTVYIDQCTLIVYSVYVYWTLYTVHCTMYDVHYT